MKKLKKRSTAAEEEKMAGKIQLTVVSEQANRTRKATIREGLIDDAVH